MVALLCGLHPGSLTLVSRRSPQDSTSGLTTAAQTIRRPCPGQVAPAESLNRVKQAHPLGSLSPPVTIIEPDALDPWDLVHGALVGGVRCD